MTHQVSYLKVAELAAEAHSSSARHARPQTQWRSQRELVEASLLRHPLGSGRFRHAERSR